jgi:RsiW-degrading membrane proteinase PrsW (M82 family)
MSLTTITYAAIGGFLPALFWLWFWLHEDRKRPEPRGQIMLAFLAGMIAVPIVIPLERWVWSAFGGSTTTIVLWAAVEEFAKYLAAFVFVLRSRYVDEPIDALIYLMTTALGFAALENVFFLMGPLAEHGLLAGVITGNLRFIGATLLHTLASAAIGGALALSFHRHARVRHHYLLGGLIAAISLHSLFNILIIASNGSALFSVFAAVWGGMVGLIVLFERIKRT